MLPSKTPSRVKAEGSDAPPPPTNKPSRVKPEGWLLHHPRVWFGTRGCKDLGKFNAWTILEVNRFWK